MAGELKNSFAELEQRMDELRKMKDEIQDTKHYLESIIKVATVGIIVVDTEGRFEFGNTAFFEIVGWPVTDLLGEPFMNVVHPDHREYMCRIWDAGQKEGATPSKGSLFEIDIAKKNGERRSLLISYTDMMIGSERKYCIVFKDITEKKQAEKALVRTNDELNAANEELTVTEEEVRHNFDELQRSQQALAQARKKLNLLNTITFQDIQNALFSLEGYLELQRELPMDEKAGAYLNKEKVVAEKISNTLAFAKNYQNMGINPPLWQNTNQVFLLAISHLDISGFIRNIILDNLELYADPLLETVFFNLAENVTRHGKTATEISLYYRETNDSLTVFIEDNGGGIPDTDKEKIFERGYGGQKGMGLFLVREILGITDISIKETGMYGQGARFEIIVPKGAYRFTDRKERMDQ